MKYKFTSFANDRSTMTVKTSQAALHILQANIPGVGSVKTVGPNEYEISLKKDANFQYTLRAVVFSLRAA